MKRTAAYPLAMIWYGRTLTRREQYSEAEYVFRELWEDSFFPTDLKRDLSLAEANMWLRQKIYDRAIPPLKDALDRSEKKREKARIAYILYQLYDKAGNYQEAYNALDVVLHSSPDYEMEFNARLHQIVAGWANQRISTEEANKSLDRMTRDDKNLEYRDQIYYEMANIALADNQKKEGIALLRQSLSTTKPIPLNAVNPILNWPISTSIRRTSSMQNCITTAP
ncbi:MAG: hypothetical protein IPL65_15150 [Lewinellaceae bacterium]|nr:hypothetical protein [Lewinellaceae bacterium]